MIVLPDTRKPFVVRKGVFPGESWDLSEWNVYRTGSPAMDVVSGVLQIVVPGVLNNKITAQWGTSTKSELPIRVDYRTTYLEFGMKVWRNNNVCDTAFALEEENTGGAAWNTIQNPFGLACPAPTDNVHWFIKRNGVPASFGADTSDFVSDSTWQSFKLVLKPRSGHVQLFKDGILQGTLTALSTFPVVPITPTVALTMVGATENTTKIEYLYVIQEIEP